MRDISYKRTRFACYSSYFTMSSIFCVPPILFVTLREMYGISYTLLGSLVLVNFCTQLAVDLIFTAFSRHFNTKRIVRVMPLITSLGLMLYALVPLLFPSAAYVGLLVGTVIFSVSAGLSEVLLSPTIAAMPSDNPQRDMSFLHSLYAFGVLTMIIVSTVYLKIFGAHNWYYLILFLSVLPVISAILFMTSPMPDMSEQPTLGGTGSKRRAFELSLFVACIFFGSCAENTMGNWISGYMETALGIDKTLGDILGAAMFAVLLGTARILYSRLGRSIAPVLLFGMIGASALYIIAGLSTSVTVSFIAAILIGLVTSMLWPGTLIMMEEKIPGVGVTAFALMASGGDLGAAIAPQLMGIVTDAVSTSELGARLALELGIGVEQVGLRAGVLLSAVFPLMGIAVVLFIIGYFKKKEKKGTPV